jgi:hypothetical protein
VDRRPSFRHRVLRLAPDEWHAVVESEWTGALVLLRRGTVELFGLHGDERRFEEGAVLCFDGVGAKALHNPGSIMTLIEGIARGGPGGCPADPL